MDLSIILPNGSQLDGNAPVIVLGPNGSGKTRQARNIQAASGVQIGFVNALRNTRVAPELPVMGMDTARANYSSQLSQARSSHWELTNEFDFMLSQLLAQRSMAAIEFTRKYEEDPTTAGQPEDTPLGNVEKIWKDVFPGRKLVWRDWKPVVASDAGGTLTEYSGNQMSDGEKAALFLAGRTFSAEAGVLVVDEPETHLHSLLAVRLWDALEAARPDIRFVYITHDLTFALSRRNARYVLASPTAGLREIAVGEDVPDDVAGVLLGSASLSFYATRVVFCEGDESSWDNKLYNAWFNGPDTVIRSVGSCQRVMRCVDALTESGVANSLQSIGIVDRDFHAQAFLDALPGNVTALPVHEVESIFVSPLVVEAVCAHLGRAFSRSTYAADLTAAVSPDLERSIVVNRWKARLEPRLTALIAGVGRGGRQISDIVTDLPDIFDHTKWNFSPADIIREEEARVRAAMSGHDLDELLAVVPGKPLIGVAAKTCGLEIEVFSPANDRLIDVVAGQLRGSRSGRGLTE